MELIVRIQFIFWFEKVSDCAFVTYTNSFCVSFTDAWWLNAIKQQILHVRPTAILHHTFLKPRSIGLNVAPVCPTLDDGNCLYGETVESLSVSQSPYWGNYGDLRKEILFFVDHNRHLDFVATFSDTLNVVEDGNVIANLDTVIRRQYRNGEYVHFGAFYSGSPIVHVFHCLCSFLW